MPSISRDTSGSAMQLLIKDAVKKIISRHSETPAVFFDCINVGLSIILVLLGGLFAGLTLAFMGQDRTCLQVIARSGTRTEREDAQRVLNVLQRGRHWVLVSLLLGNVIVNETLPIVLDRDVKGGFFAILASTVLIVIFGEIIPQSICAKHGLTIGSWSSRYVLYVMYGLFPLAYPAAKLLDMLLGRDHGIIFNRAGLKALISIHEHLSYSSTENLTREEVAVMSSVLDLQHIYVSQIMIPIANLFTLDCEQVLDGITKYNIAESGYSEILVSMDSQHGTGQTFMGVLPVKSLVALNFDAAVAVGQLALDRLPVVNPNATIQETFGIFRDKNIQVALVTERGLLQGVPVGVVMARDIMNEILGE